MNHSIEEILNGNFDFSDEDIVIGNILELFKYSNNIVKYLNESTNHIPGYDSFIEKTLNNSKKIQKAIDEKQELKSNHFELLNSRRNLEVKKSEVDLIKADILKIKKLKAEYQSIDIEELKKEYRKLLREHNEKYAEIDIIKNNNKKLAEKIESFNQSLKKLNQISEDEIDKIKIVFSKIDQYVDEHWDGMDDKLVVERKKIKNLTTQYNDILNHIDNKLIAIGSTKKELQEKEKELNALSLKYEKLQKVYNTEFEQNSKYIEMNSSELDILSEELKDGLNRFNLILSEVVDKNEKIKDEIREANR